MISLNTVFLCGGRALPLYLRSLLLGLFPLLYFKEAVSAVAGFIDQLPVAVTEKSRYVPGLGPGHIVRHGSEWRRRYGQLESQMRPFLMGSP